MRLNHPTLIFFIFLFFTVSTGYSHGNVFEWEPFSIRSDLALNVPPAAGPERKITFITDGHSEISDILERDADIYVFDADSKSETKWKRFNFRHFILTFSHFATNQREREITGPLSGKQSKWDTIKSLPMTFLHSPSQDTFESIGRIFEPEFNLGVEF
jgi:hypothetical protein